MFPKYCVLCLAILMSPFLVTSPQRAMAQATDQATLSEAAIQVKEATTFLQKDGGALWGKRLDEIPWFLILGQRVFLTADPKVPGYQRVDGFWSGPLPPEVMSSNSSLKWAGRKWAMLMIPIPTDRSKAVKLMIHEVWHGVQPDILPLPHFSETGAGAALLNEPDGRIWLQLEWRALAAALTSKGKEQDKAVESALLFRARRYAHALPDERDRERLLDLAEGLAEYTGWKLSSTPPTDFAAWLSQEAFKQESYTRSFAYFTGPAYGFLLDQRAPGWIAKLRGTLDLQMLLAQSLSSERKKITAWLKGSGSKEPLFAASEQAGAAWDLAGLRRDEGLRWQQYQKKVEELKKIFVSGPTLRLRPSKLQISFYPLGQVSLGEAGTLMPRLAWKGSDGAELAAPDGALVSPDWKEMRIPITDVTIEPGTIEKPTEWSGHKWNLKLPKGWKIRAEGTSRVAEP